MLGRIAKAAALGTSTNSQLTKDLEPKSRVLDRIARSFVERGKALRVYSFFETQKMDYMNCLVLHYPLFSASETAVC